jgi:glycosyltransferase involved in cell wall biosynthesis
LRIVQVGAYPPPYGGVSVHLRRLHEHLLRHGMDSTIIDLSPVPKQAPGLVHLGWPQTPSYLERQPRCLVHFHNFAPGHARAYDRLARRHITVLSLHNERFGDELRSVGPLRRRLALARLRRVHSIVVDSERCRDLATALWGRRADIHLIPEFIPPAVVPPLAHPEILALRARCGYLLASNAWKVSFHRGQDLYGLDLLVELLRRLARERGLDVGLACLVPGGGDETYLEALAARVRAAGLAERCVILTEPLEEASSLWRLADVVVRATNTDGSSLSVLEALSLGVPVVASDCVARPEGTVLFRTRDADDLTGRVAAVLADLPAHAARARRAAIPDGAALLAALYAELGRRWQAPDA